MSRQSIEEGVRKSLQLYFEDLQDSEPSDVYDMVMKVVEKPLLEEVMKFAEHNQSRAAQCLGLNRNTLRKKLKEHRLL